MCRPAQLAPRGSYFIVAQEAVGEHSFAGFCRLVDTHDDPLEGLGDGVKLV